MGRYVKLFLIAVLALGVLLSQAVAQSGQSLPKGAQPATTKQNVQINPAVLCPDPAAKLQVNTAVPQGGGTAIATLNGQICNVAAVANYSGTQPLDAKFQVITWHPPHTAAQEADLKIISHTPMGNTLKAGECKPVKGTYQLPNFVYWTAPPTHPLQKNQRQVIREFSLCVAKEYPEKTSFSKQENCSIDNDCASVQITYIESF